MVAANSLWASRVTVGPLPSSDQLAISMTVLWHGHRPHDAALPFHGPVAGLRLTRIFGAASGIRVKYPCNQRIRSARVTLRWRGTGARTDTTYCPILRCQLQR